MYSNRLIYSNIQDSNVLEDENGFKTWNMGKENHGYRMAKLKRKISHLMSSILYKSVLGLFFLYALFSESFRLWTSSKPKDTVFYSFTLITFIFFCIDLFLHFFSDYFYHRKINCYLEIIATLTILLDLGWIYNSFFTCSNCAEFEDISYAG